MLKIPLLVSLGHHGGRRKVASLRPPFSTPLRSLGEPDPETPFLVPIEHAPPLFVRIREDKISLKISPAPLRADPPRSGGGPDPPEVAARERKRSQRQSISSGKPLFHYKFYELKNKKNFNEKFEHVEIANFF